MLFQREPPLDFQVELSSPGLSEFPVDIALSFFKTMPACSALAQLSVNAVPQANSPGRPQKSLAHLRRDGELRIRDIRDVVLHALSHQQAERPKIALVVSLQIPACDWAMQVGGVRPPSASLMFRFRAPSQAHGIFQSTSPRGFTYGKGKGAAEGWQDSRKD